MGDLSGQWVGRYTGSNSGSIVIELDDLGDHYEGTAIAWDDTHGPNSVFINVLTIDKNVRQTLNDVATLLLEHNGDVVTTGTNDRKQNVGPVKCLPSQVEFEVADNCLRVTWTGGLHDCFHITALIPRSLASQKSFIEHKRSCTWKEYKDIVNACNIKTYIYRGYMDSAWRLRSSFFRAGRASIRKFDSHDVRELQKVFSYLSPHIFDLDDPKQYLALVNLAQHHGYPTPLLDWTWSPYVAAFFAYHKLSNHSGNDTKTVRICQLNASAWNRLARVQKVFAERPNVTILDALAYQNPRVIPQQAITVFSNVDDIESHIQQHEVAHGLSYLAVFDLPAYERDVVMRELDLMGVTAGSLFPGLDGTCETLKERNF